MSAPSFSSFPPVFDSFPDLDAGSSSGPTTRGSRSIKRDDRGDKKPKPDRERKDEEKKERKRDSDKRERKKEKKHRRKDDDDEREHSSKYRKRRSSPYDENEENRGFATIAAESYNRLYYIDRKGDELNIKYGSLHSGDIPKYWHVAREFPSSLLPSYS